MSDIVWEPTGSYIDGTNIKRFMDKHGIKDYDELIQRAADEIEWFWDAIMEDLNIEWYEPYHQVLDTSEGIQWAKWYLGGKVNVVHNCIDKHADSDLKNHTALIWEGEDGEIRRMTYHEMYEQVNKCANALKASGVRKGDTVGIYMPMSLEIVIAFYAVMKIGAIVIPIFSGYGGSALSSRLSNAESKVLFTADGSYRRGKQISIKPEADRGLEGVPTVEKVVVLKRLGIEVPWNEERDIWWDDFLENQPAECPTEHMDSEDFALLIYTSGTTGKPKGAVHTHGGCLAQIVKELGYFFDVKHDSIFFWLSDIGWMMGPWEIIGVHTLGGALFIFEGAPNYPEPDRLWEMIERHKITHLGISPTAIRMLMRYGNEWVTKHDLSNLKYLGSTGEPWDPESWNWFFEVVGKKKLPIINISGGTEIVGCFLSPLPITALKPCSLRGPGLGMAIDCFNEDGESVRHEMGHLVALKPAPSMTRGFWKDPDRYIETYWSRWPDVWWHGDWAYVDEDGFWSLHGRSDDVIKVAGRRTGPAEVESALIDHAAVSEAAAIGVPHDIKGEAVITFVVLQPGVLPSEELREELRNQVGNKLGKPLRPDELKFVKDLPKTRSAKIVRRVIRAKYMNEELGDLSSVENPDAIDGIGKAI